MNRLRELREGRFTQAEMAAMLGVGRTTYTKYERGDIRLTADVLSKVADIFSVSIDYILGLTDNPAPSAEEAGDEEEIWQLREAVRRDPERRILFSLARNASISEVRQAVAIIDALRKAGDHDDDPA